MTYDDRWDGSAAGQPCRRRGRPRWGTRQRRRRDRRGRRGRRRCRAIGSPMPREPARRLFLRRQDGDGYPDTNETVGPVRHRLEQDRAGPDERHDAARDERPEDRLRAASPRSAWGRFRSARPSRSPTPFRFKVAASADRAGAVPPVACTAGICSNGAGLVLGPRRLRRTLLDDYAATFTVTLSADQFDVNAQPQSIVVDLDLNSVTPVQATSTFVEGFESGLGNFMQQNLDGDIASNAPLERERCQYNDPDYPNSNSYGDTECYLGFRGQSALNDWHPHDTTTAGRRPCVPRTTLAPLRDAHRREPRPRHVRPEPAGRDPHQGQPDNLAARDLPERPRPTNKRSCNAAADCVDRGRRAVRLRESRALLQAPGLARPTTAGPTRRSGRPPTAACVHAQIVGRHHVAEV